MKTLKAKKELQYQSCSICMRQFKYASEIKSHYQEHADFKRFQEEMPQNGD
jgi:hypothetical protein